VVSGVLARLVVVVVVRGVLLFGRVEDGVKAIVWDASHSVATVDVSFILNELFLLLVLGFRCYVFINYFFWFMDENLKLLYCQSIYIY